jgi:hypothetical protein
MPSITLGSVDKKKDNRREICAAHLEGERRADGACYRVARVERKGAGDVAEVDSAEDSKRGRPYGRRRVGFLAPEKTETGLGIGRGIGEGLALLGEDEDGAEEIDTKGAGGVVGDLGDPEVVGEQQRPKGRDICRRDGVACAGNEVIEDEVHASHGRGGR